MHLLAAVASRIARFCDWLIGWLLLATVVINLAQVFTRYVMNDPLFWTEEVIRYVTVWFTFMGAAAVSKADEHMDMNLFNEIQNPTFQAIHKAFLQAMALVFALIVTWQGMRYTMLNGTQTAPTTGLPMLYVYGVIPIGGALLSIVCIYKIVEAFVPSLRERDAP